MNTNESLVRKVCPKCKQYKPMTRHHIYPKCFYGKEKNDTVFLLCRDCHTELEKNIPSFRMPHSFYPNVVLAFIKGKEK